jgi:hypothetical protein
VQQREQHSFLCISFNLRHNSLTHSQLRTVGIILKRMLEERKQLFIAGKKTHTQNSYFEEKK